MKPVAVVMVRAYAAAVFALRSNSRKEESVKKALLAVLVVMSCLMPSLASAKGAPLLFNTGDELFEIEGAPKLEDGYSVGYACKRFAVFWADVWTWDCELTAVNLSEFSVTDLPDTVKAEVTSKYSESDRKRNLWNHYGILAAALVLAIFAIFSMRKN